MLARAAKAANLVLIVCGVASLIALAGLLYHYGWSGQRQVTTPFGMLLSLVLAATVVSLASLRLKPAYKIAAAFFYVCLTISTYGVEVYLRVPDQARFRPDKTLLSFEREPLEVKQQAVKIAKQFGVDVDTRDRIEVIKELAKRGVEAVPQIILPTFDKQKGDGLKSAIHIDGVEIMALSGVSDKMTVVCNQNGEYFIYRSDKYGFHNPGNNWRSANLEIAAVGNSFTMGYCVPSEKSFVGLVRKRYPATLNLGMAGEGPLHILAVLKEYLEPLKPKRVLWFYFEGNNLAELQDEKRSPILMRYLQEGFRQGLSGRQNELDYALMSYLETQEQRRPQQKSSDVFARRARAIIKLTSLRKQLGLISERSGEQLEVASTTNLDLLREILTAAKQRVAAWGGQLYFVYLPTWERYAKGDPGIGGRQRMQVLSYVKTLDLALIDLLPAFESQARPLSLFPFERPGHYNEKGHRLVADEVIKAVT